ncbi:hypothetical protein ACOZ32_04990 [Halobacterium sp. MBLA0001]|uniref:hypothetical protein n=1 Tax=Halobacterium sp. MBLA0001 TaxID=3413511 RepID=UPI003C71F791
MNDRAEQRDSEVLSYRILTNSRLKVVLPLVTNVGTTGAVLKEVVDQYIEETEH